MKTHWFVVLGIAGIVLLVGSVPVNKAWGSEVRWAKLTKVESATPTVLHIPTVISDDVATSPAIMPVQWTEPAQQPPALAPPVIVQPESYFLETRPLDRPMPPGATLNSAPVPVTPRVPSGAATTAEKSGRTACGDLTLKSIREISHDIRPSDSSRLPEECAIENTVHYGRHFGQTCFMWKASALSTRAAYFEDVQLERYGNTIVCPALQPVVSGAKFFATIPILPYKMGVTPPSECVYTLGHRRPGNCAPYMVEPFPISPRGALFQAGAVAGGLAVIP